LEELEPTIESALTTATFPENIRFAICLQETEERLKYFRERYKDDFRVSFNLFHYNQSEGIGFGRQQSQNLYKNETFILTIDSHTLFTPNWDIGLIRQLHKAMEWSTKPILSYYPAPYLPNKPLNTERLSVQALYVKFLYFFSTNI
jgi:hypothetical protein